MNHILKIIAISKPYHKWVWILSVLILISAVLQILSPVLFKQVVDQAEQQLVNNSGDVVKAYQLLGLMFGLGIASTLIDSISMRLGDYTSGRIGRYLTEKFYQKILTLPQKYFDSQISGKIINQLSRGIISLQDFLGALSNFIVPALIQTIFTLGVMAYYNLLIAGLATITFPLFLILSYYSTQKWGKFEVMRTKIEDLSRGRIQEVISNIKLVRSFNQQHHEYRYVSDQLQTSVGIYDQQSTTYHVINFLRNTGLEVIIIIIFVILFRQTFSSTMSFGELVLILQLLNQLRRPLFSMSFVIERIKRAETGSKEYFEILALESTETMPQKHLRPPTKLPSIEFCHISFEYENSEKVLSDISFKLDKSETVALVGHSGAGKTTIVNLILKFYNPTQGDILFNGKNYQTLSHQQIRSAISLVFQDSELFSTTIRDNVAYGSPNATDEKVIKALKKANAYDFVKTFKAGIDQPIGERGIKLSGGQKQRIQIARAILMDAPILILDEATSSLDAKSEKLVQDALEKLMQNKLVLIIAHRFSTIQNVDRILVLDNGQIVDQGNPQSLAKKEGLYSELLHYQIQGNQKLLEKFEIHS